MGDDEEGESPGAKEPRSGAARPGRGGGTVLPFQLGNGGRRGGEDAKAPLPSAGNGTQRDLATPLLPPFSPARFKEPFIILHIRTDTMVGLWGRGLGVWSLSSANKMLPEDEERIRK